MAGYSFEAFKAVAVAIPFYAIAALEGNKKKAKVIETKRTKAKPRLSYLSKTLLTAAVKNRTLKSSGGKKIPPPTPSQRCLRKL